LPGAHPVFAKSVPFQFARGFPGIAPGIIPWQYAIFLVVKNIQNNCESDKNIEYKKNYQNKL